MTQTTRSTSERARTACGGRLLLGIASRTSYLLALRPLSHVRLRRLLGARLVSPGRRTHSWLASSPCCVRRFVPGSVQRKLHSSCAALLLIRFGRASVATTLSSGSGVPARLASVGVSRRQIPLRARRILALPLRSMVGRPGSLGIWSLPRLVLVLGFVYVVRLSGHLRSVRWEVRSPPLVETSLGLGTCPAANLRVSCSCLWPPW